MGPLTKKLLRTIKSTRGQFLAIAAVVMVGIAVYISMNTAYLNLDRSKDNFYRENNFADYYFHVIKAPETVKRQIESINGVGAATGRIQVDVPVIKDNGERATARLVSYPSPIKQQVNQLHLLSGRMFDEYPRGGRIEALIDPQYAAANHIKSYDTVKVIAEGRLIPLTVVGTAVSPEFVYPMKDAGSLMPEPKTFVVVMLPQYQAQQMLNMKGQINQVVIKLVPGADSGNVADQVNKILDSYGNLASYPRKQQLSNAVLQAELDGLKASSKSLPLIFVGIAVAIEIVMLGRMIKSQKSQIGIMKALGYTNRQVMTLYTGYALAIAIIGALTGAVVGVWSAFAISQVYAQYFNLPQAIGGVNYQSVINGFIISSLAGLIAGLGASRQVVGITPAESMRPDPPRKVGRSFMEGWHWLWSRLNMSWRMSLRSLSRNKVRAGVTLLGVIFAVSMLIISLFANDSIDYMLKKHYYQEQNYDYLVRLATPVKESDLLSIYRMPGVFKTEPFLEVPIKIINQNKSEDDMVVGLLESTTMRTITNPAGQPVKIQDKGIILSERTANKLGVAVGDQIKVKTTLGQGPARSAFLRVTGISRQLIGSGCYASLAQVNMILREAETTSGVMLKIDPGYERTIDSLLKEMNNVSAAASRQEELDGFMEKMGSMLFFTAIMVMFAAVLGFAIIYNATVISFAERKRELASLRVLGFTIPEVAGMLLKENLIQSVVGLVLGLPMGWLMVQAYVKAVSTDLYVMPAVVYPKTYLWAAVGGLIFVIVSYYLARRSVLSLNMVEVLKDRD